MASSEYEAMTALHGIMPDIIAEPLAWGAYEEEPDTWFYASRYCQLDGVPGVSDFPALLAELHRRGASTKGQFGFDVVTYGGRNPSCFPVTNSWEETFSRGLARIFGTEEQTHGPDEEMRQLRDGLMTKVIPRLLRPLESEGRSLTPTLVHGDLWDGNAAVDVDTGSPVMFDATPLYAHNKYEMGPWWAPRHRMTGEYIAEYIKHFPVSEPKEDFRDRGLLYRLRFDLHASSLYAGNLRFRHLVKDTMRDLLEKYPLGYEGYLEERHSA